MAISYGMKIEAMLLVPGSLHGSLLPVFTSKGQLVRLRYGRYGPFRMGKIEIGLRISFEKK